MNKKKGNKKKKNMIIACVAVVIGVAIGVAAFFLLNGRRIAFGQKSVQTASEVRKLKKKDLELKYPSTPSEVVKLYWRLNKCLYNSSLKEDDLEALLKQLRLLYDDELLQDEDNSWDNMLQKLKEDKKKFSKEKRVLSTYTVDKESAVTYAEVAGKECATLSSTTMETVKSKGARAYAKFMCRKDGQGKWKILGWEQIDKSETTVDD